MAKYVGFKIGKVHESYVISEYYCGGCGYPVTDHDSFCPECGGAFRECDASNLEAENAKLRQQLADVTESMGRVEERCAKLRELVQDMWFWGYEGHMDSESQEWQMKHIDGVLDRVCELANEVDE